MPKSPRLLVGTSGYSYPPWKGRFYPDKTKSSEMLTFYGEHFSTVELNSTFYTMPEPGTLAPLLDSVGRDFVFAIKAPQKITHHQRLQDAAEPLAQFHSAVAELKSNAGPVLYQLPPNFKKDIPRLSQFLSLLPRHPAAFEFRHASWFDDETTALLRRHKAALCIAESDDLETPRIATANFGYLRLRKERYGPRALQSWAAWIGQQRWQRTFIYFMHEDTARGPRYAKSLARLLAR